MGARMRLLAAAALAGVAASAGAAPPGAVPWPTGDSWQVASAAVVSENGVPTCQFFNDTAPANASAVALYDPAYNETGWAMLYVTTSSPASAPATAEEQAMAAGCAEGYLTAAETYAAWLNYANNTFGSPVGVYPELQAFMVGQLAFIREGVAAFKAKAMAAGRGGSAGGEASAPSSFTDPSDVFWAGAALLMAQFDGLLQGSQAAAPSPSQSLTELQLYMWQANADMNDLMLVFPGPINATHADTGEWAPPPLPGHARTRAALHARNTGGDEAALLARTEEQWEQLALARLQRRREHAHAEGGAQPVPATAAEEAMLGYIPPGPFPPEPLADQLTSCSALVSLAPGAGAGGSDAGGTPTYSDVLVAHTTWRHYFGMLRIYKHYNFTSFAGSGAGLVSLSSSPGLLFSQDDWYVTPTLVIWETTNSVWNTSLWEAVTPRAAMAWQRIMVATWWTTNGSAWAAQLPAYTMGTYPNSYTIVDSTRFTPGAPLPASDLVWTVEEVPGYVAAHDVTPVLAAQGYWASYNIPYDTGVFAGAGYPAMVETYGPRFSYAQAPRALLFARNYTDAVDIGGTRAVIRYNNWAADPLGADDPLIGALSARGDLRPNTTLVNCTLTSPVSNCTGPLAFGGVDAKVVSLAQGLGSSWAESGPTHDQQPVFQWSANAAFVNTTRSMLPDVWAFGTYVVTAQPPPDALALLRHGNGLHSP